MWGINRQRVAFMIWAVAIACASFVNCRPPETGPTQNGQSKGGGGGGTPEPITVAVEHGTDTGAEGYYKETFDALGVASDIPGIEKGEPGMSVMLGYLGYPDLKPSELEDTPSDELMKRFGDDLLSSAFFAPKITDVSQKGSDDINVGWRKVIRLRAKPDSDAAKHGIAAGFLLFNKFQGKNHSADPFLHRDDHSNESKTTQLILARAQKGTGTDPVQRPIHFFVFGPVSEGAKLKLALQASFDAVAPEVGAGLPQPIKDYFVPIACGQCHGGLKLNQSTGDKEVDFARQKVNFLDTDHWFDRVQDGDDFAFLRKESFGVLFDGGKDETIPKFAAAFDVLRRLNTEIREQNERVEADPSKPSFQLRAITRWLQLHASGDNTHKDVFARALPPLTGAGPAWEATTEPDKQLLPLMNQFCYRCHSSIIYGVFDRNEVACRKVKIKNFLNLPPGSSPKAMPQDRVLDPAVKATLLDLVAKLPDAKCVE
jgi:hypothetical protein